MFVRIILRAIASNGHGRMIMNQFIIEHLGLLQVVVVILCTFDNHRLRRQVGTPLWFSLTLPLNLAEHKKFGDQRFPHLYYIKYLCQGNDELIFKLCQFPVTEHFVCCHFH